MYILFVHSLSKLNFVDKFIYIKNFISQNNEVLTNSEQINIHSTSFLILLTND